MEKNLEKMVNMIKLMVWENGRWTKYPLNKVYHTLRDSYIHIENTDETHNHVNIILDTEIDVSVDSEYSIIISGDYTDILLTSAAGADRQFYFTPIAHNININDLSKYTVYIENGKASARIEKVDLTRNRQMSEDEFVIQKSNYNNQLFELAKHSIEDSNDIFYPAVALKKAKKCRIYDWVIGPNENTMPEDMSEFNEKVANRLTKVEKELARIRIYLEKSESHKRNGYNDEALIMARKAAEAICEHIFKKEVNQPLKKMRFDVLINKLEAMHILPGRIVIALRTVQGYGNYGAHPQKDDFEPIDVDFIEPCLNSLSIVTNWYFNEYLKQV